MAWRIVRMRRAVINEMAPCKMEHHDITDMTWNPVLSDIPGDVTGAFEIDLRILLNFIGVKDQYAAARRAACVDRACGAGDGACVR